MYWPIAGKWETSQVRPFKHHEQRPLLSASAGFGSATNRTSSSPMDHEAYQKTQAQLEAIEQEIKATQPLTSELLVISSLKHHYPAEETSSIYFLLGIEELSKKYSKLRKTRGDGNCYYRSFLYNLAERLLENPTEHARVLQYVKDSLAFVTSVGGYAEMAIEIFYDSLVEFLEGLSGDDSISDTASLHVELTQENATSDYCTWYLRVLTATYLKADPARFIPYLEEGYVDIASFCQQQIEPMGKECSMVQVLALAEAFRVRVEIEYLDGHPFESSSLMDGRSGSRGGLTKHCFGPSSDDATTTLTLLYRPGHYDILYLKS